MSGDATPSTRDLARRWLAAVRRGGCAGAEALALTGPDFRLHLPRALSPVVAGAGLDIPRERLAGIDTAVRGVFDVDRCQVARKSYDIFQGDKGGMQAELALRTPGGKAFEIVLAITFARAGDTLSAVWVHADTAEVMHRLAAA
ncbi:hypothetical protein [Phenylobacterium sp.]|jgi:hypothetical protein|uniref:hypothetical protein n=1 Tax=Phenylobacterium sp. TaxID=1871053 RepID=UPI002F42F97E